MRQCLTHLIPVFLFFTLPPLKRLKKTSGFLIPDVGRKMERWTEMGEYSY